MTLTCADCNFKSSEVNFGGEIQKKGCRVTLSVNEHSDINRQIIKADSASVYIPALDFEIPSRTQRGTISTIEGVMLRAAKNLESTQQQRLRLGDVDNFHRCQKVIRGLKILTNNLEQDNEDLYDDGKEHCALPFDFIIDDPGGNSFIENSYTPNEDVHMTKSYYRRTSAQDIKLGLKPYEESHTSSNMSRINTNCTNTKANTNLIEVEDENEGKKEWLDRREPIIFQNRCPSCQLTTETRMCVINIPHFREVLIMSLACDKCGYRSNEVKSGGGICQFGTRINIHVCHPDDLTREVLKSDTAGVVIPEIELEMEEGGLDGVFTTVEGLLDKIHARLSLANPFRVGDSAIQDHKTNDGGKYSPPDPSTLKYHEFLTKLQQMKEGTLLPFTLCITDPLSNSFVGPIPKVAARLAVQAAKDGCLKCYEDYIDPGMEIIEFKRTCDQNEILGLNDLKTENYQNDPESIKSETSSLTSPKYYGTDQLEENPDRLKKVCAREFDHPVRTSKGSEEGDVTVMGNGSRGIPPLLQKGQMKRS